MQTIYLDECGYTGEDLLNKSQPFFVICTHSLTEQECSDIKARYFSRVKAQELKHKELKRPAQRQMIVSALAEILERSGQIKVGVVHKRYALAMKLVDILIEPSMYTAGFDLYKNGGNFALSNIIYGCMGVGDSLYLDEFLQLFQDAIRERTPQQCKAFIEFIATPHPVMVVDKFRNIIFQALQHVGFDALIECQPKHVLDLSLSTAFHLVGMWRETIDDAGITIVHDRSSNMAKQKFLWDALVSPDAPPAVFGKGAGKKTFPLAVHETSFIASHESAAIQIADIIAGSVAHFFAAQLKRNEGEYENGLATVFDREVGWYMLLPSQEVTPEGLGTVGSDGENEITYIAERILRITRPSER